jgi:hypothetical protein
MQLQNVAIMTNDKQFISLSPRKAASGNRVSFVFLLHLRVQAKVGRRSLVKRAVLPEQAETRAQNVLSGLAKLILRNKPRNQTTNAKKKKKMECGSEWVDMNADSEEEMEWNEDEDLLARNEAADLFDSATTSSSSSVAAPPPPPPAAAAQQSVFSKV